MRFSNNQTLLRHTFATSVCGVVSAISGRKVDFVFLAIEELQRMVASDTMGGVYHRGYYILVDEESDFCIDAQMGR